MYSSIFQPASMPSWRANCRAVVSLILAIALTSCSAPPPPQKSLGDRRFTSVALISPADILSVTAGDTRADRVKEGVGVGAASGSLGGMLVGAAACGPYLYGLCVMGLGAAGLLAGGAGGAIYGYTGISGSKAEGLAQRVSDIHSDRDLQTWLVDSVLQRLPPEMLAEPAAAEVQVVLTIEKIEFNKLEGKVHVETTVMAAFESTESRRVPEYGSRLFTGQSGGFRLEELLDQDSSSMKSAVDQSMLPTIDEIVEVLNARWTSGQL